MKKLAKLKKNADNAKRKCDHEKLKRSKISNNTDDEVVLLVKDALPIMIIKLLDVSTSCQHFHNSTGIENGSLSTKLKWNILLKKREELKGSCLKQDKVTFARSNVVNSFVASQLDIWARYLNTDFTLKDCLFGVVSLAKNVDWSKYYYSGYGIGFQFSFFKIWLE